MNKLAEDGVVQVVGRECILRLGNLLGGAPAGDPVQRSSGLGGLSSLRVAGRRSDGQSDAEGTGNHDGKARAGRAAEGGKETRAKPFSTGIRHDVPSGAQK